MRTIALFLALVVACSVAADVDVRIGALALHVTASGDHVAVEGLPVIEKIRDAGHRLIEVRANGQPLLTYQRNPDGRLTGVTIADRLHYDAADLAAGTVTYNTRRPEMLRLRLLGDPNIAPEKQWKVDRDGSLYLVPDASGVTRYYAVVHGPDRIVFDRKGQALLYDLDLLGDIDQGAVSAAFFSRLVLTAKGDLEVSAPFAPAGSLLAVRIVNNEIEYERW